MKRFCVTIDLDLEEPLIPSSLEWLQLDGVHSYKLHGYTAVPIPGAPQVIAPQGTDHFGAMGEAA